MWLHPLTFIDVVESVLPNNSPRPVSSAVVVIAQPSLDNFSVNADVTPKHAPAADDVTEDDRVSVCSSVSCKYPKHLRVCSAQLKLHG